MADISRAALFGKLDERGNRARRAFRRAQRG
jgi:hypothetical protein